VEEALRSATAAPVTTLALMERFRSRRADTFADKVVAALRREFGGHPTKSA
jgi:6-phosphogluconate dehydrogenase